MEIAYPVIIASSAMGIILCLYLTYVKKLHPKHHEKHETKEDCHLIITSPYSKFFHVPVELLGLGYYAALFLGYLSFLIFPGFNTPLTAFTTVALSTAAFIFSIYLMFIQLVTLKRWCGWCIVSAVLCAAIFLSSISISGEDIISVLAAHKQIVTVLHIIGAAIGLGAATVTDVFFFKFLRNFKIEKWEAEILHQVSEIIWFGLGLLILSGLGLYLPNAEAYGESPKFLTKMIVVLIITLNGFLLNLYITPRMIHIRFDKKKHEFPKKMHRMRKIAFACGAISFISWYTAITLGALRGLEISFTNLLLVYFILLLSGVIGSQLFEYHLDKIAKKT